MTTTEVEIVMPYGVTVESKPGDRMMKPVKAHPKRNGTSSLSLVDGPCRVAASYRGPEGGLLQLVNGNSVTVIGKIPSGGGCAKSWRLSARRKATLSASTSTPRQRRKIRAQSKSSQPTSSSNYPPGGGVDDCTNGRLRATAHLRADHQWQDESGSTDQQGQRRDGYCHSLAVGGQHDSDRQSNDSWESPNHRHQAWESLDLPRLDRGSKSRVYGVNPLRRSPRDIRGANQHRPVRRYFGDRVQHSTSGVAAGVAV